jgi:hypothetical protein
VETRGCFSWTQLKEFITAETQSSEIVIPAEAGIQVLYFRLLMADGFPATVTV